MVHNSNYDVGYYLKKFKAIPDSKWTTKVYDRGNGVKCVFGHCGCSINEREHTVEAKVLSTLFKENLGVYLANVNDGDYPLIVKKLGDTPRERIIMGLLLIKNGHTLKGN